MIFAGDWRDSDREAVQEGADLLSGALSGISDMPPGDALSCLVGDVVFESAASVPGHYHAYVTPGVTGRIMFRRGKVTARLVIHELGHLINDRQPRRDSPAFLLGQMGIKMDGKLVTGPLRGGYCRNAGQYAPANGYQHDGYPWQQHPRWWKDGNTPTEDWADMLLAWANMEFADNEAGKALRGWVTDYLKARLSQCVD